MTHLTYGLVCGFLGTLGASIIFTIELAAMRRDTRYDSFLFAGGLQRPRQQQLLALSLAVAFFWIATLLLLGFGGELGMIR